MNSMARSSRPSILRSLWALCWWAGQRTVGTFAGSIQLPYSAGRVLDLRPDSPRRSFIWSPVDLCLGFSSQAIGLAHFAPHSGSLGPTSEHLVIASCKAERLSGRPLRHWLYWGSSTVAALGAVRSLSWEP